MSLNLIMGARNDAKNEREKMIFMLHTQMQ